MHLKGLWGQAHFKKQVNTKYINKCFVEITNFIFRITKIIENKFNTVYFFKIILYIKIKRGNSLRTDHLLGHNPLLHTDT